MTLKMKNATHITLLTLMVGLAVWVSIHAFGSHKEQRVVGVVEVGEIQ
jgi:hypothetical protein